MPRNIERDNGFIEGWCGLTYTEFVIGGTNQGVAPVVGDPGSGGISDDQDFGV